MPDVAIQNAWVLYKASDASKMKRLDLLAFRRVVVKTYTLKYSSRVRPSLQLGMCSRGKILDAERLDGDSHYPQTNQTQRRCANCGAKVKVICVKCQVGLHIDCLSDFHS